ncbi:hypothetical protein HDU98_003110 [Podochytrium sp. JEL0797]|nr:hypothetical protein HDU98_003110 [Podochytrium sp. JEL0797]
MLPVASVCRGISASISRTLVSPLRSSLRMPREFISHRLLATSALAHKSHTSIVPDNQFRNLHSVVAKSKKKGVRSVVPNQHALIQAQSEALRRSEIFRATAFSTAESYDFSKLQPILESRFQMMPFIADDVYMIQLPLDQSALNPSVPGDCFFFSNGVFVTWGASDHQIEALLRIAHKVGDGVYSDLEVECQGGIINDTIVIGSDLPSDQYKLAFSSGLARSAKLASLENQLDAHLDKNKQLPNHLQKGKRISMGRHAVLKDLGVLFKLRGNVNLHSELLDLPDFCWSSTRMESAFHDISRNLDVKARIAIFNKKLDYANELADVLKKHLHEEHGLVLEWIIILLIAVAVVFCTVNYRDELVEREKLKAKKRRAKAERGLEDALEESKILGGQ